MSSKLSSMSISSSVSSSSTTNSQFKHTLLWNSILTNLKTQLIETNNQNNLNKLKKQHSRFVTASVGGMLLIKQNLIINTTNTLNNLTSSSSNPQTTNVSPSNSPLETIYFTGSQCIDIVFNYLTQNKELFQFERQITREKCTKLCQLIMNSGIFEPLNRSSTRFDDTSLKYYKFKSEYLKQLQDEENKTKESDSKQDDLEKSILNLNKQLAKTDLSDHDDNYHQSCFIDKENRLLNNESKNSKK